MDHIQYFQHVLSPYGPKFSVVRLVDEINRLYHSYEASSYDERHPLLHQQLPEIWHSMVDRAISFDPSAPWDVLDFGCGTGFASEQVLSWLPKGQLRSLTCFDPSTEMLDRCRQRLKPRFDKIQFISDAKDLSVVDARFNRVVTNSVLHHLSDPVQAIRGIDACLIADAIWLCGHEPSTRFYRNPHCTELYHRYERSRQWRRYFEPSAYLRRLARGLRLTTDPAARAATAAHRLGLFQRRPPRALISRLVDFHVAASADEAELGSGFDALQLQNGFRGCWNLEWQRSYNFLGPIWEGRASSAWRRRCDELRRRFPEEGANFCSIWRHVAPGHQNST